MIIQCNECRLAEVEVVRFSLPDLNTRGWYCTEVVINHDTKTKTVRMICPTCAAKRK